MHDFGVPDHVFAHARLVEHVFKYVALKIWTSKAKNVIFRAPRSSLGTENFRIYYLTEKMRSQADPFFSDLCDRVGRGNLTDSDVNYLKSRIRFNNSENEN